MSARPGAHNRDPCVYSSEPHLLRVFRAHAEAEAAACGAGKTGQRCVLSGIFPAWEGQAAGGSVGQCPPLWHQSNGASRAAQMLGTRPWLCLWEESGYHKASPRRWVGQKSHGQQLTWVSAKPSRAASSGSMHPPRHGLGPQGTPRRIWVQWLGSCFWNLGAATWISGTPGGTSSRRCCAASQGLRHRH